MARSSSLRPVSGQSAYMNRIVRGSRRPGEETPTPASPHAEVVDCAADMDLGEFQEHMRVLYGDRDRERGLARSFAWFAEECGELSRALFRGDDEDRRREFADVLAWLASLADQAEIDLAAAAHRYVAGCPRCGATPCACNR